MPPKLNQAGIDLIKSFEQLKLRSYPDPYSDLAIACREANLSIYDGNFLKLADWRKYDAYPWTCGWGNTGPDVTWNTVWTKEMAEKKFQAAITFFSYHLYSAIGTLPLNDNQFSALVSFSYNVKNGTNIIKDLIATVPLILDNKDQVNEFLRRISLYNKSKGQPSRGLMNRRDDEIKLFLS